MTRPGRGAARLRPGAAARWLRSTAARRLSTAVLAGVLAAGAGAGFPPPIAAAPLTPPAESRDDRFDVPFRPDGRYDPAVPPPEAVLGYPLGSRFTPHHRVMDYMRVLADRSPRCTWVPYGVTYEGRMLGTLIVTSPQMRQGLDDRRKELLSLTDPERTSPSQAEELADRLPIVVWLSYNIHGDEASSSEAALQVAWELAAGTDPGITGLLDSLVVIIDPCLNPDGRDRYVNWYNDAVGRVADGNADTREHDQPWPGGRFNHYLFDLNRDWAWTTQSETKAREKAFLEWRPQVHVDFHEMSYNSSYFFFPPAEPVNTNLPPQVRYWEDVFGRGNARAFDEHGWLYYTAEEFDLYYPGYGDSWPSLQGATGMTYEQAGHARAGLRVERKDGTVLSLRERIRHHVTASLATLRTARAERRHRLLDFYAFFEDGVKGHLSGPAAYLIPPEPDPGRAAELANLLLAHGARVEQATATLKVTEPRDYDGRLVHGDFPAGTYVVPMRQPLRALLNTLLEPEASLPESLFYDITAWSLPLAFGVEASWTDHMPGGPLVELTHATPPAGGVVDGPPTVAWLLPWDTNDAPRLLARLLALGVRASFATRPFEALGHPFGRGTIVIPAATNSDSLGAVIDRLSREVGLTVYAAPTGLTGSGVDLGSDKIVAIRPPRIGVVCGDGVDPTSFGAVWYLLDQQYQLPMSQITLESLGRIDLSAFNTLVLPDDEAGDGTSYAAALDSLDVDRLKRWVRSGGTFVGLKGGAAWATVDHSGLTTVHIKPDKEGGGARAAAGKGHAAPDSAAIELARKLSTVEEQERTERLKQIPGTILRVKLDPTHPLAFGYGGETRILKTSRTVFELSDSGHNVGYYPESPLVSGYLSRENARRLANTPFLTVESVGRGRAVLYNDDPNFRLFWYGLNRLFLNSLFFANGY